MKAIPLAGGYTFHTEVQEVVTVEVVGFLKFETRQTKRVGYVCDPQGVHEHGLCVFMDLSLDEDTAVQQVKEQLDRLLKYYEESEKAYKKMLKKLGVGVKA